MWPWEHVIVGYLIYSLVCRMIFGRSPGAAETIAVVFASILPDLIDKPLAWQFGVFDSGYALGHSIFFAVPLAIIVGLFAQYRGRTDVAVAFALGYLLHLPADVADGYFRSGMVNLDLMLWPVVSPTVAPMNQTFMRELQHHLTRYHAELTADDPSRYLIVMVVLALTTLILWILDGAPVLREILIIGRRKLGGQH